MLLDKMIHVDDNKLLIESSYYVQILQQNLYGDRCVGVSHDIV